ncbi:MAG TPA: helix-turn-helix domain-containing protein [Solirubrobacteraceae bacterium]|jgi:AraC-like DNA-binding protein|nr:helix-turn-helix domain-containing protein [Solirubrobacteraceae bacterium]
MRLTELAISSAALACFEAAGIHDVEQIARQTMPELIERSEFCRGVELHEVVCELSRHGLTPFTRHGRHVQTAREREILRLRIVKGLTLDEIAAISSLHRERIRQLLHLHFGLVGKPPAARCRRERLRALGRDEDMRPSTLRERHRLYARARLIIERQYAMPLTVEAVAKTLASSPRQLQRAFAEFGDGGFQDDLFARRMTAAAILLSHNSVPMSVVARRVGYRQPGHFARAFRRRYGVPPSVFRADVRQAKRSEVLGESCETAVSR